MTRCSVFNSVVENLRAVDSMYRTSAGLWSQSCPSGSRLTWHQPHQCSFAQCVWPRTSLTVTFHRWTVSISPRQVPVFIYTPSAPLYLPVVHFSLGCGQSSVATLMRSSSSFYSSRFSSSCSHSASSSSLHSSSSAVTFFFILAWCLCET